MSTTALAGIGGSFAPENSNWDIKNSVGYSGIVQEKEHKPGLGACEERPKSYDWKTGEITYSDSIKQDPPIVCYLA